MRIMKCFVGCKVIWFIKNLRNFLASMVDKVRHFKMKVRKFPKKLIFLCPTFMCLPPSNVIDNFAGFWLNRFFNVQKKNVTVIAASLLLWRRSGSFCS